MRVSSQSGGGVDLQLVCAGAPACDSPKAGCGPLPAVSAAVMGAPCELVSLKDVDIYCATRLTKRGSRGPRSPSFLLHFSTHLLAVGWCQLSPSLGFQGASQSP